VPRFECLDLAQFGLPLISPDDPRFPVLVRDIELRPQPFTSWPFDDWTSRAVLVNDSGKAIIALAYVWRCTMADGSSRSHQHANLGSNTQLEILNGRSPVVRDLGTCILAGSKRLISEWGMFGNNLDVLSLEQVGRGSSYAGAGGSGIAFAPNETVVSTQLGLDLAIFEDGLCVGPDESGLVDALKKSLELQRSTAEKVVVAIGEGASEGEIFEILLPLARRTFHPPAGGFQHVFLPLFSRMAIDCLTRSDREQQLAWFEIRAQPSTFPLHRPV
jgi:hypothetical protein